MQDFKKAGLLRDREMELKSHIGAITAGAKGLSMVVLLTAEALLCRTLRRRGRCAVARWS